MHTAHIATAPTAAVAREPSGRTLQRVGCIASSATALRFLGRAHAFLYRWSAGRLGGSVCGRPVLLLSTRGRRTGRRRTTPVCFLAAEGQLIVVAAAGGRQEHPGWYLNLRSDPRVDVQLGPVRRPMVARVAEGGERARLWERICRQYPVCSDYERRAHRTIPVVLLAQEAS